jgi:hypothetical protein
MPIPFQGIDSECDRNGRSGRIRFIPGEMMGTEVSGGEDIFRIRYLKGFCEFAFTGKCTIGLLTVIFKTLVRGSPTISDFKALRDVTNVIEMQTLIECEPDQDIPQDAREIEPPKERSKREGDVRISRSAVTFSISLAIKLDFRGKSSMEFG